MNFLAAPDYAPEHGEEKRGRLSDVKACVKELVGGRERESNRGWSFARVRLVRCDRRRGQDLRLRSISNTELTIVSESRATIAKARRTTTKEDSLPRQQIQGQLGLQTQALCFQRDVFETEK